MGKGSTTPQIFDEFYTDLRALAGRRMAEERLDHTLQATALVHEAFMRLAGQSAVKGYDRRTFLSIASETIRRILVDHARATKSKKRGGGHHKVEFDEIALPEFGEEPVDILEFDQALQELAELNPRQARVVELRFFAGLSVIEAAEVLEVSEGTIKGDWRLARSWLRVQLNRA
ncbi:MAG: ECF-type sigma factor [Planctomycetota bacterium]|jgi:RNA polymerase sigma factor (TIGR02999 family)